MFAELTLDHGLELGLAAMQVDEPTPVQHAVLPLALSGRDLLISAETGSGKTLAYLIPTVQALLSTHSAKQPGTQALVLVPTRELARQTLKHCRKLTFKTRIEVQAITGGADFKYQRSVLRKDPHILIGTPGRILEHCERGSTDFSSVRFLVVDEADRTLDLGLREDVLKINGFCPTEKQVLMLSATLQHRGLGAVARQLLVDPETVNIGQVRQPHSSIFHQIILADNQDHKDKLLFALLQKGGFRRALVFANKRAVATRLAGLLAYRGLRCSSLHGELSTEERKLVLSQYGEGKLEVLCASDLAARGLDIPEIDLVVNYDMPRKGDDYLHRTGRTGRAGKSGLAVSLVGHSEWNLMVSIGRYLKLEFERRTLPGLKARYNGPKAVKKSGKATGGKKKSAEKVQVGKRRKPKASKKPRAADLDGFAPLRKRSKDD